MTIMAYDRETLINSLKALHPTLRPYIAETLVDMWLKDPETLKKIAREDQIKQSKLSRSKKASRTLADFASEQSIITGAVEVCNPEPAKNISALVIEDEETNNKEVGETCA